MPRTSKIERKTSETTIRILLDLDGTGKGRIDTTIPFLDHMLTLTARHGLFDLTVKGSGDTDIDDHHLVEDIGICLGKAFRDALAGKEGINRYGSATVPMDESLGSVHLDVSGRSYLVYDVDFGARRIKTFDLALIREFFQAFADAGGMTLHVRVLYGKNSHHMAEAVFKAFARALREAVSRDARIRGVLSTKGTL
ncbi:MAG: Imidazoleglycerol-phosphate dehydratase [Syntrophaceae bacterium PtaB.Bin038]|nr:MAG: Imidazoleglycerol-phosphate dehydratase [Syntrophaceae bacterium PtaB.Bin038]